MSAMFGLKEARYKIRILAYKLRRENEAGLSKDECIKELGSFMTAIGLSRGDRAKILGEHMKHFK